MKEIFENYVDHSLGEEKQAYFKYRQFEVNYKKYLPAPREGQNLLDIGIGRGEMLSSMINWGYKNVLGVDISPSTIVHCKSLDLPCELVEDSTGFLHSNAGKFDVITLLDVLEHIPKEELIDFVKALNGALRPGGVLIIQVPNLQAPDGYLHRYNDITHVTGFVEHSLAQVLLASGFIKFKIVGFEQFVFKTPVEIVRRVLRSVHWIFVRLLRGIDGNINPRVLNPVFSAIVYKS